MGQQPNSKGFGVLTNGSYKTGRVMTKDDRKETGRVVAKKPAGGNKSGEGWRETKGSGQDATTATVLSTVC